MGCCGKEDDTFEPGVVHKRSCRDVLCLLLFLAFWGGMFVVCGISFKQGDPKRLIYGIDSYGFTCGSVETFRGLQIDFTNMRNLYYLNPLDLLDPLSITYAKKICVDSCPGSESACNIDSLPCTSGVQYRCPYYRFAEDGLYGRLTGVADTSVAYWDALGNVQPGNGSSSGTLTTITSLVSGLSSLPWVSTFMGNMSGRSSSVEGEYLQLSSQYPGEGPCYPVWVQTDETFHRCFPQIPSAWKDKVVKIGNGVLNTVVEALPDGAVSAYKDKFESASETFSRYVGDISKGVLIIVVSGLVAGILLSLLWMIILRYMAGVMAWLTILLVNLACIGITLYCFKMAGLLGGSQIGQGIADLIPNATVGHATQQQWKWIGIGAAVVAGIVLLVTLLMIRRIRIAVACIKVASQAVGSMPAILLFPILPFVFEVGLVIYWVAVTAMLYSAGDITAHCRTDLSAFSFKDMTLSSSLGQVKNSTLGSTCYTGLPRDDLVAACASDSQCYLSYDWNNQLKYSFIYHFFGLLWTNQFIIGFTCVTIAGAIASYYWANGDSARMPSFPVLAALKNTVVYHLGSIAFGALVMAIIMFIRYLLDYLDKKTKEIQQRNVAAAWAMCCVKCCVWVLEKITKFINRNAYIMIGVKGSNYCVSAFRAVKLIISNALRVAAVNVVGDILIFLAKLAVAAGAGIIAFAMSSAPYYTDVVKYPDTYLASPVLPIAVSIITAFAVAEIFFAVYEMAIDTILLSFCEDCEQHNGTPHCAPALLMEAMGEKAVQPIKS